MLTERMQRQAIHALVQGHAGISVRPERFGEPWRSVYMTTEHYMTKGWSAQEALAYAATVGLRAQHGDKMPQSAEYDRLYQELLGAIERSGEAGHYRPKSAKEVAARHPAVAWLWEGWMPRSMLSLVVAKPGVGKTHWMLDLVRSLQQGRAWPDGQPGPAPSSTVWIEGEGISPEVVERGEALGIDMDRMYMIEASDGEILDLTSLAWQEEVIETVAAVKPALVVVDSLSTITPNGQDRSEQVTPLLIWLVGLARWSGAAVALIHHLRKSNGAQMEFPLISIDDIRGSGQIVAQSRSVIAVNKMGHDLDAARRLEVLKKTISRGATPKPLGMTAMKRPDGLVERFEYGDAPSIENGVKREECAEWLLDMLSDGPVGLKELVEAGETMGFNKTMIWRTRKALGGQIVDTHGKSNPKNRWSLASSQVGSDASEEADDDVL